jgi:CubicO group peptidase (beta-lactamase class C family)
VLVAKGDAVLLNQAWGEANVEWAVANTPETRFRIGSISKQFAAAALLLLEERGELKTSDLVKGFVPDAPAAWAPLTLHHLLTHTSGIPNVTSLPEFPTHWKWVPTTIDEMVSRFRERPLVFAPGSKFAYSNSNYLLLGYIIERVSGMSYAKFLRERILEPLGLRDTGLDSNRTILPRRASGYVNVAGELENAAYSEMTVPHAAGAMYSTTHDLHRWMRSLFSGKLLSPSSLAKLLTPEKGNYAYGLRVATEDGRNVVEHGGSIAGFSAQLSYYPDDQLTVVVLANRNTPAVRLLPRILAKTAVEDDSGSPE